MLSRGDVVNYHKGLNMSTSNSIRIDATLFTVAREEGALMSRSTAQQVEHWAKMGCALEACGLTVEQVGALLQSRKTICTEASEEDLWAFKRDRQRKDIENMERGLLTQDQLSWFSGGKARNSRLIDSPY